MGGAARLVGAHLLIDESVAFSRARPVGARARSAYWVCGILLFSAWNLGTVAGMLAGAAVPDPAAFGVDAAFPAGLLALLLPALRRRDARRVGTRRRRAGLAGDHRCCRPGCRCSSGCWACSRPDRLPSRRRTRRRPTVVRPTRHRPRPDRPMTWTALLILAAATYLLRVAGLVLRDRLRLPARVERYVDLGATALLVALVATVRTLPTATPSRAGPGRRGSLSGALAAWRRAPFVLVVLLAAGTTGGPARARRAVIAQPGVRAPPRTAPACG